MDLFVNNMADTENVKSYMSYVQKYTKIIQLRNNSTVFEELEVSIVDLIIAICSFTVDEKLSQ
jgi:hypothetical protein